MGETRLHVDAGAVAAGGIVDHEGPRSHSAVLVGEDAYFVRDNAMGVADGVGGWSRVNKNGMSFSPNFSEYSDLS